MTRSAIDVHECTFPVGAYKPVGQSDRHRYSIAGCGFSVGVLYAREAHLDDGVAAIHISISLVVNMQPHNVGSAIVDMVRKVIEQQGLDWPNYYEATKFEAGPFKGRGIHIWETKP